MRPDIVDAHQHCWQLGQHDCSWPTPDLVAIYRDYGLPELMAVALPLGVKASVLVQSQPSNRDTDYLLDLAARDDFIKAVVGWVDLASPDAVMRIHDLASGSKLRGLRPMLQGLPEDDWILRTELRPALQAMIDCGLVFDALVFPRHLPAICQLATRYPDLCLVVNHGAKPPIATADKQKFDEWCAGMTALAGFPQVNCKMSGLVTEAGEKQGIEAYLPCVDHILQCFGSNRLLWGSDWPVVNLAANPALAGYSEWLKLTMDLLAGLPVQSQAAILGANARRLYKF